jgi:tetratricopeptide (TPR) repeat protein
MATMMSLSKDRRTEQLPFWRNEIGLFSLAKPRSAWLVADSLDRLEVAWLRLQELLNDGGQQEAQGRVRTATDCYREALTLAPYSSAAAERLIRCLWTLGERAEALRTVAVLLEHHAHDSGVVRAAVNVLIGCGAYAEARGVCDEYLMVNPHDQAVRVQRDSLERH